MSETAQRDLYTDLTGHALWAAVVYLQEIGELAEPIDGSKLTPYLRDRLRELDAAAGTHTVATRRPKR